MRKKLTREEKDEREWKRRQDEAAFYERIGNGPIAFTRPGPPPATPKLPQPKQRRT